MQMNTKRTVLFGVILLSICVSSCSRSRKEVEKPYVAPAATPTAVSTFSEGKGDVDVKKKAAAPSGGYSVAVSPSVVSRKSLELLITTNIPGTVGLSVDVMLHGLKDDDPGIGPSTIVTVTNGEKVYAIDTSKLPRGLYDVKVEFYPRWGLKDAASRATGLSRHIVAQSKVRIVGSGESAHTVLKQKRGQHWVMLHVTMGDPWVPSLWRNKFGGHQSIALDSSRYNPRIIKAYYFKSIDMTIFVNTLKHEITVWRVGKATS